MGEFHKKVAIFKITPVQGLIGLTVKQYEHTSNSFHPVNEVQHSFQL